MASKYLKIEETVRKSLSKKLGKDIVKRKLPIPCGSEHEFDGVSPEGDILIEIKASTVPTKGELRHTQLAEMCEACLLLMSIGSAKRRILALSDVGFHNLFIRTMQAKAALSVGIEIMLVND